MVEDLVLVVLEEEEELEGGPTKPDLRQMATGTRLKRREGGKLPRTGPEARQSRSEGRALVSLCGSFSRSPGVAWPTRRSCGA